MVQRRQRDGIIQVQRAGAAACRASTARGGAHRHDVVQRGGRVTQRHACHRSLIASLDRGRIQACCCVCVAESKLVMVHPVEHQRQILQRFDQRAVTHIPEDVEATLRNAVQVLRKEQG